MKYTKHIPYEFTGAFSFAHRKHLKKQVAEDDGFAYSLLVRVIDSNYQDKEALEALTYLAQFNQEYLRKYFTTNSMHPCNCIRPNKEKHDPNCLRIRVGRMHGSIQRDIMNTNARYGETPFKEDPQSDHIEDYIINLIDKE